MNDERIDALAREAIRLRYSRRGILKRASALGLSSAAATVLARTAAPAPAAARRQEPVTLNWFAARDTSGYTGQQVDAFNAQSPDLQINYQEQGATTSDLRDKFVTVAVAEDPSADLVSMDVPFVPEFAAAGWTIPVEEILPPAERDAFFAGTIAGATYDGQLYAVPWYNNGPGLFYRKDLLDAAGLQPPRTYDELREQALQLQTPEIAGFVAQLAQTEGGLITFLEFLWGHGGALVAGEGPEMTVALGDGDAGTTALQQLFDFVYTDQIIPESALTMMTGADAQNVFVEGNAVFRRMWMTAAEPIGAEGSAVQGLWDVTTLPSATGDEPGPGCLGTWNLGISRFSRYPEESAEAIRWLTSLERQTERYLANGSLPARSAVFDDPEVLAKYPYVPTLRAAFEALRPRPVTPYYGQMSADVLQPNFGQAITRQKDPAQAIADMASGMASVLQGWAVGSGGMGDRVGRGARP